MKHKMFKYVQRIRKQKQNRNLITSNDLSCLPRSMTTNPNRRKTHTFSDATEDKININSYILLAIKYPEPLLV